ncbi:MAG TPA: polyphenol oxidase family protein, partial [Candidatus Binatia bacterium]|nr:polyphenol oxidase family protein [Candidatus Binatia bacterium]
MTTRVGGVSTGPFASLNLGHGSGDAQLAVEENRRRTAAALALPGAPHWLRQVHGTRALQAPFEGTPEADAAWTCQAGVVCVVQAADCLPVLLCDESATVVAAAHAGWRGLAGGVLESTVSALPVPPARLMAWLGVAIG